MHVIILYFVYIFFHHTQGFSALELATKGPRLYTLRTGLGIDRAYTSMAIIPPQLASQGLLEVLLGTSDNSVLVLYEAEFKNVIEDQQLQGKIDAPIVKMAVAPNGVFLACYRSDGVLTVMTAAFSRKVTFLFPVLFSLCKSALLKTSTFHVHRFWILMPNQYPGRSKSPGVAKTPWSCNGATLAS